MEVKSLMVIPISLEMKINLNFLEKEIYCPIHIKLQKIEQIK